MKRVKIINIIDENIATCLYTGLLTDTGNFVIQILIQAVLKWQMNFY